MTEADFADTVAIFKAAIKGIRNDESLGDFLVELGASLVALGVQEQKHVRPHRSSKTG